jgi:hypothetical protein
LPAKRLAASCKVYRKHPTGIEYWATIKCNYCGKRGYPDYRYYKKEQDTGAGVSAGIGAIIVDESTAIIEY